MHWVRQIAAWLYGCYAWSSFLFILLLFGGLCIILRKPRWARPVARCGARLLFFLVGMPVTVKGLDKLPAHTHVLLLNHSSFVDGLALTALLPAAPGYAFIVRQEFKIQVLLWPLLKSMGTVVLDRPAQKKSGKSNVEMLTIALRRGNNLLIFPEGGFIPEPGLQAFHSGAFVAAAYAQVPLVVAGLQGARTALRPGTWLPRRARISLEIGPVLLPTCADQLAIAEIMETAHKAMVPLSGESDATA